MRAFPSVLNEIPSSPISSPDDTARRCYTSRTLMGFASFFGLAEVEKVSDDILCREYRVKALPLLGDALRFQISEYVEGQQFSP